MEEDYKEFPLNVWHSTFKWTWTYMVSSIWSDKENSKVSGYHRTGTMWSHALNSSAVTC